MISLLDGETKFRGERSQTEFGNEKNEKIGDGVALVALVPWFPNSVWEPISRNPVSLTGPPRSLESYTETIP
jgi:hypothetical protein